MVLLDLLTCLYVIDVTHNDCLHACSSTIDDFEDALLATCVKRWKARYIITRDKKGFAASDIPALSPEAFMER